jgi:hypothetical protein
MSGADRKAERPVVLLVQPPVYDFALYDLFFKPYGLLRLGAWFERGGYELRLVNGLDYGDDLTLRRRGPVKRHRNGTGKFPRRLLRLSEPLPGERTAATGEAASAESGSAVEGGGYEVGEFRRRFAERTGRYINRYGIEPDSFRRRVAESGADLALVTSQMTYWYPGVVEAVDIVRELLPRIPLAVGGVYASLLPEHCRAATAADEVITGGDIDALRRLLERNGLPVPPGEPPDRPALLPGVWEDAGVLRLNRGCPYRCPYCASGLIEPGFERGRAGELWETLLEMAQRFGTRSFAFYDDALLMDKEAAFVPFLERVIASGEDFSFYLPNAVHLRYLDRRTAELMRRAGFEEIRLGYETADSHSPASTGKYERASVPEVIETLRRAGFSRDRIILYLLAGLPGQHAGEVEESVRSASRLGARLSVAEYSPVPGTLLWTESVAASAYPIDREPLFQNNSIFPLEWEGFPREDMERLKRLARESGR